MNENENMEAMNQQEETEGTVKTVGIGELAIGAAGVIAAYEGLKWVAKKAVKIGKKTVADIKAKKEAKTEKEVANSEEAK